MRFSLSKPRPVPPPKPAKFGRFAKRPGITRPFEATGVVVQGSRFFGPTVHAPQALAPVAIAALALGAGAIGALAIGRLSVGKASFKDVYIKRLEVDDLKVNRRLDGTGN